MRTRRSRWTMSVRVTALLLLASTIAGADEVMPVIVVDENRSGFALAGSGEKFVVWGVNYDHDESGRLLEDYWKAEWAKVEEDFGEIKQLGANVVRIHLQVGKFLESPTQGNAESLEMLGRLLALSERLGLYLDITGLACYHKQDVPEWYDALDEPERWKAQEKFWELVSERCHTSPAVFCYDLMNEPVVAGGNKKRTDWLAGAFAGKHFVQFINLSADDRARPEIALQWVTAMTEAIRRHDRQHLVTVGLVPWSLDRPGLSSGFVPDKIAGPLDFVSVHLYPEKGKVDEAMDTLKGFAVGKPVLIEEMFPLKSGLEDMDHFVKRSAPHVGGHVSFYWGKTIEECNASPQFADKITGKWLEYFQNQSSR